MAEEYDDVRNKYLNLIDNILEVYGLAKKARFTATNDNYFSALGGICRNCAKMIAILENTL